MRYWTSHWRNRYWNDEARFEGRCLTSAGSNVFTKRGVSPGDFLYIVSIRSGRLLLAGRLRVAEIVPREEAIRRDENDSKWEAAEWVIAQTDSGTPLDLHRELATEVTESLRFVSNKGPRPPFFATEGKLDHQTTRGVRELTTDSARLLDRIITSTQAEKLSTSMRTVTISQLGDAD